MLRLLIPSKLRYCIFLFSILTISCKEAKKESANPKLTAQQIVDKAIERSGGLLHKQSKVAFDFRNRHYTSEWDQNHFVMTRYEKNDSTTIMDTKAGSNFERLVNGVVVSLPDSLSNRYANGVNSVHYFARLPFGLNDQAVYKELLGQVTIKEKQYHKLKITFDQANGGDDFDDVYLYWINADNYDLDYLAYEYHVNGGGIRFREAMNGRKIEGITFLDYKNLKPKQKDVDFMAIDKLYEQGELELLSEIKLENVKVGL